MNLENPLPRRATGRTLWKRVFRERGLNHRKVYSPLCVPSVADGRLYGVTRSGGVLVLAAKPQFEQLARNELKDRSSFDASPAVDGNRLLIRSDKFLYCIGTP